jgi:signal peptidase I
MSDSSQAQGTQPTTPQPVDDPTSPEQQPAQSSNNAKWAVFKIILDWSTAIVIVLILHFFVFQAFHVSGTSMMTTLHNDDYLIVSKLGSTETGLAHLVGLSYTNYPAHGQIIVFHFPEDTSKIFVKRVIGLPGDHVVIANGRVSVFNRANPLGYNPDTSYEPSGTFTIGNIDTVVPAGNIFVLGDNRTPNGSYDSRSWGELPLSDVIGNVVLRLLPVNAFKLF